MTVLKIVILLGMTIFFRLTIDKNQAEASRYSLTPPPPGIKFYSFGFQETIADSLWLRYLQDVEKCKLFGLTKDGKSPCAKGWSFQMLDQITDLAPKFRMPYAIGPLMLTVLVDDQEGAGIIFDKATKAFPDDWRILYRAAYFYIYGKPDPNKAAKLLIQAHEHGGPEWLPLLAGKLYGKSGQIMLGIATLKELHANLKDPRIKKDVESRLARLTCQRDAIEEGKSPDSCGEDKQKWQPVLDSDH